MSEASDNKYKWTPESTTLLVSVWTDKQVQKQLEFATKPELIWDSIARYMKKKGYNVTGRQCRSRMKRLLICYREAKRAGTKGGVEQYYESIDRVFIGKKCPNDHVYGDNVDTIDSAVKSPPKDVKTNKNLQMRHKFQEPTNCVYRTDALTPTWIGEKDQDYPDSPESNDTVLAQPFRVFSPVRDAATNTRHHLTDLTSKIKRNVLAEETPIKETINQTHLQNYYNEMPLQNAVQNVQNQIIQENMQQNQALLQQTMMQKRLLEQNMMNPMYQQYRNVNHTNYVNSATLPRQSNEIPQPHHIIAPQSVYPDNVVRIQNHYQQNPAPANRAVPQEPRRSAFSQNYRPRQNYIDLNHIESISPSYSPDNLNDAFCQTNNTEGRHNLNETFNQPTTTNGLNLPNVDATVLTNNATFNDDTLSIEFLQDSSSVSDNEQPKSKDCSVNTDLDLVPSAPFRKKKQQKLEQLMLNAINSQNDVVNKILSAQKDMVNRLLDVDRDRQNRLEHRLDNLLDVVRATVINKSNENDDDISPSEEPLITNLAPPPKPGVIPPKLDLVPPKPCRVPCTMPNGHIELINQNPINTRPGVVSPILSPNKKPGAIWAKLGPVSTSPFVRAQQQLGFPIPPNMDTRTKSSAERRIAKEVEAGMDPKTLILETMAFIEMEKQIVEKVMNAKLQTMAEQENNARRRLFSLKEPSIAMVLTTAFLEAERHSQDIFENARIAFEKNKVAQLRNQFLKAMNKQTIGDEILRGQGKDYEKIQQLSMQKKFIQDPCDASTPAKPIQQTRNTEEEPRQTIQQLAQLVMNSARWRDAASARRPSPFDMKSPEHLENPENKFVKPQTCKANSNFDTLDSNIKTLNWIQDRYSYPSQLVTNTLQQQKNRFSYNGAIPGVEPLGFVVEKLTDDKDSDNYQIDYGKRVGFVDTKTLAVKKEEKEESDHLEQLKQLYLQAQKRQQQNNGNMLMALQNDLIQQYMKDMAVTKGGKGSAESDTDEEFLDTTATMQPRRGSLTSGTSSKASKADKCVIS